MPKLKLGYDNADDAQSKLVSTFCLYKGRAISVKNLWIKEGTVDTYLIQGAHLTSKTNTEHVEIEDPEFNCSEYNIGYVNQNGVSAWFCRNPQKQYLQGLKYTQVTRKGTHPAIGSVEFKHSKPVGMMLEDDYPKFMKAAAQLVAGDAAMLAFNKNFAMSRDKIHKDFILEYKGQQIGFTPDLKAFELMEEHFHLMESLKEAAA